MDVNETIEHWKERVEFLKHWKKLLVLKLVDTDKLDPEWYRMGDKIYKLETEIHSKEQFITSYEADLKVREEAIAGKTKFVKDNIGSAIGKLRECEVSAQYTPTKRGLLERFKKKTWKSDFEMIQDFQQIQALVQEFKKPVEMKAEPSEK